MSYVITIEKFRDTYEELEPLYRKHYKEMTDRLESTGIPCSPYNPRLDSYAKAGDEGWLLTFVLRAEDKACGYSNVYITNDMHNQDLIAQEDTIYVLPEHRNGVGKAMVRFILNELNSRGVKRALVSAMTDLRVAKMWKRMGFKEAATQMLYTF
jgi:ribosomal protein S18 acetylase RimI-like enzyme